MKTENAELEEYGITFLKRGLTGFFIYKVPYVHCGKIKNLLKDKNSVNYLWFHYPKKSKLNYFLCTSENQNWLKLCYCSLFGVFYRPVFPY